MIPYSDGSLLDKIRNSCEISTEEYVESGVQITFWANEEFENRVRKYLGEPGS